MSLVLQSTWPSEEEEEEERRRDGGAKGRPWPDPSRRGAAGPVAEIGRHFRETREGPEALLVPLRSGEWDGSLSRK